MIKRSKKYLAVLLAGAIALSNITGSIQVSAKIITPGVQEYEIYPVPQKSEYKEGSFSVGDNVNVIFESGVDVYTRNRLTEILKNQNITFQVSDDMVEGKTNVLIGINDSGELVDNYFNSEVPHEEAFFDEKTDAHLVYSNDGVIGVLGEDADSAFYGVTTLKHVFNQLDNNEIKEFRIDDYANVAYRGFIEGYYGNPWSNEDRAALMTYGGDYKLNQYIFAPKDDPYHNSKWRELYPEEKLEGIKKLAAAGEASKTRYVYALHPFMNNAIRFDSDENYQKDLNIIKDKFTQLLKAGVRQFGILADDASVPAQGPSSYVKLLNDLTEWLREQQKTYTDLKDDIIFCPNDYMGSGASEQLKEINKAGDNVSIVMTGGRIWGEVSQEFATNFKNNIASEGYEGREPYFWINWPCSDNSKKHLIMGGNDTFLHPGVQPESVKGIVLNPMQQAEANKSALFAVADYSWNIWDNKDQANQNWQDSFKYMDHGTAEETESSTALREISKHMINQNMDSRVTALQESVELAPKLNAFKEKYESGANIKEDAEALIQEFTKLKEAAAYYKENPGNTRTRDQIIYWLNCWEDTTDAAINYLKSAIAVEEGNKEEIWNCYSEAQASFEKSKTYGFHYVDHTEYAEVGVQHIVPFIKFMGESLSGVVSSIVNPNKVITTFITNRKDSPTGNTTNAFDNNAATEIVYKTPNKIDEGTFVGVKYNKKVKVNTIEFLMGAKANLNDTMAKAKIQYTEDGKTWVDLNGEIYTSPQEIRVDNLDLEVQGIRLIATEAKENTWLGVRDISVNKTASKDEINPTVIKTPEWSIYNNGNEANLTDGNDNSSIWYVTHKPGDITRVGDYVGVDLGKVINVGKVHLAVGADGTDKWTKYKLEYSSDNTNWTTFKEYEGAASGKDIIDEDFEGIEARYVRITNMKEEHKWVKFSEIKVEPCKSLPSTDHIYTNTNNEIKSVYESDALTKLVAKENITLNEGEYIGIKLDRIKDLKDIDLDVSNMEGLTLQTSLNGMEWSNVTKKSTLEDARYIRIIADKTITFDLNKLEVTSNEVYEPSLVSAYVGTYGDNVAKLAFDGNLNTYAQFSAVPRKGNTIVYDLGQTIDVNNLKYLVLDTEKDHIRDAKIQLSLDGKEWTDAIVIGDGKKDEGGADAKPQDNGYTHGSLSNGKVPISHAYMDSGKINVSARYLRVEFTADYDHRWTVINEFLINDGEYIPTVNDPTFISDPIEIKGFSPSNIMDGDLTTFYKPDTKDGEIKSGSLTYRLSENTDVKKINIVQSGSSISNAKVMVRTGYNKDGEPIWNQIGELNKSLNEIVNTKYDNIFEIKIEWEGAAPTIYELITLNDYEVPNISELEELIASSNYNKEDYTANSWNVYNEALESAKNIIENIDGTSQEDVNNAKESLINAITGLVNISELNKVIANANDIITGEVQYTEETLNILKEAVANGTKVIENDAATTEDVKSAIDLIEKSIDGLIEEESNLSNKHLQIAVEEALKITDEELSNIAPAVVEEFKAALEEAQAILANKEATQEEVNKSFDRLSKVMQMLSFEKGNKEYLIQLVERINSLNSNDYIVSTWDKLQEVLVKANNVIADQNAMEEEVSKTYDELLRAFLELRLKPSKDKLQDLINKAESLDSSKYTKESWSVLERKLKVAKDVLADENSTEKEISEAAKGLEDAIDGLIIADAGNNNSNNGESNSGSSSNNNGNSNSNNSGNSNSKLPKTGGASSVAMSLLGLVTVGVGSFLRRKNK
ncbi:beta-N-acetylglucosaminidase domain-containing protein [uncultured Clostridium sp.]|uniref:beta-N-acetylglucosaminidase domain-containing protein n=1 Tax=uncultured Clostridium sp. TaxID=59620 RepID=UPI0025FAFEB7|nr:beta-N-acetylglucosaminidase domain-containing protein [uncultured Clostridium sp.]MDU4884267.1 beta-N-acetylglucosaminidase domain-containing protein [Clostridium celatum]MDU7077446.1 beta-N-acetylglucosaminidase domain-containing protein [Clostridium celatum]